MKKFSKLVAVSAAAMTFGITGISALNNTNVVNADSTSDLANLNSQIQNVKNGKDSDMLNDQVGSDAEDVSMSAADVQNGTSKSFKDTLGTMSAYHLGSSVQDDDKAVSEDVATMQGMYAYENDKTGVDQVTSLGQATEKVLADFYGSNAQPAAQNANKQTANNDNKQKANNANAQKANDNANAQNNSSNKKADVVANANNNNAKKDNAQGAVANKQNTNNETNAQQNTVKSNAYANVEGAKTVANENESNSAKNQNNGAIAETQNENTTAAGETSTVVKAQAKSANNSAAQKNNTPVFPQTGEQTSEILAVAGGLIIAATAAGIVVYKKRN